MSHKNLTERIDHAVRTSTAWNCPRIYTELLQEALAALMSNPETPGTGCRHRESCLHCYVENFGKTTQKDRDSV